MKAASGAELLSKDESQALRLRFAEDDLHELWGLTQ